MTDLPKAPLSAILNLVNDKVLSQKISDRIYVGLEDIPSGGTSLLSHGWATDSVSTNNVFKAGDVLFGKLRPRLRKSIRIDRPGYCSTDILVLRPDANVDPGFAGYVAQSDAVFAEAIRTEEGTKMPRCSWQQIQSVLVYLPNSRDGQRAIARILASVDHAIAVTTDLIAKHQQIKAGMMHDLFTRGVLPNGQLRPPLSEAPELYQETTLGWIPREWRVVALHECLRSSPKNGYSPRESDTWEGFYVLGLGCLTKDGFEARQLKSAPRAAAQHSDARLEAGDLLISRANTPELVGLCGVFPGLDSPAIYPDLMMRLTLRQTLDTHFLEAQLLLPQTRSRLTALAVGTSSSMAKLNAASVRNFPVLLPSVEEQKLMLNRSKAVVELIQSAKVALEKLKLQKIGLMQDLLTGRVSVDHLAPEPADA